MKIRKTCAISQPTFLPWLGWFDLADQADVMIILDDVAFSKQSWQQRNRIRTRNGLEFVTVPVKTSGRLGQLIADCELVDQTFADKLIKTLQANYSRAPFFSCFIDDLSSTLRSSTNTNRLVELNCALISWMAAKLEVTTPMIRASTLDISGQRGEYVAALCESLGVVRYLSPAGAEQYLIEDKNSFERRGIEVLIHQYGHPQYLQRFMPFIPYASALDLILNLGPKAGEIMRSGRLTASAISGDLHAISEVLANEN